MPDLLVTTKLLEGRLEPPSPPPLLPPLVTPLMQIRKSDEPFKQRTMNKATIHNANKMNSKDCVFPTIIF